MKKPTVPKLPEQAPQVPEADKFLKVVEYMKVKKDIKALEKRGEVLRDELMTYVIGQKANDMGHRSVVLTNGTNHVKVTQQSRISSTLVPDAVQVLRDAGLVDFIESVETVDTGMLEAAIQADEIPNRLLKKLYASKEAKSLVVSTAKK